MKRLHTSWTCNPGQKRSEVEMGAQRRGWLEGAHFPLFLLNCGDRES